MEHKVRIAFCFCFLLDLFDALTRCNDLIPHQSDPLILIGLEYFGEFSRISFHGFVFHIADIEQPLTRGNLINLAHILPKQSQDFDLYLVETFNEVVHLTLYAHPDPMNPFKQLENPT